MADRNQIVAMFASLAETTDQYDANQGLGQLGWWPPEGEHECALVGIDLDSSSKFSYGGRNGKPRVEVPAAQITFRYMLIDDPDSPDGKPRSFKGRSFTVPLVPLKQLPEDDKGYGKQQTRVRIEKNRLLGHLTCLLGVQPPDWGVGLADAIEKVNAASAKGSLITVRVRCDYEDAVDKSGNAKIGPNGKAVRRPDKEYLQALFTG